MREVVLVHELVFRLSGGCLGNDVVELRVVLEGKEDGLDIGVLDAHVDHAVVFLGLEGELVLLDNATGVIVGVGTEDNTILGAAAHGLGVHIVLFFVVLHQPAFLFPGLEVLHGFVVGALLVLTGDGGEVNFRLGNVQEAFFSGHGQGFLGVEDVIRGSGNFRYQILGRANGREGFYSYHNYLFTWNLRLPVAKKSTIWRAAARPAFTLASAVWAPIFLGVANTRVPNFSCRAA